MSPVVQFTSIGSMGRFGNMLFQWCTARKFAELSHCELENPYWIGEEVFDIPNRRPSRRVPKLGADHLPWGRQNVDLYGYFQFQDAVSRWTRTELKQWLKIKAKWTERFPKPSEPYIAAHVRRGDYTTVHARHYCLVSENSYVNACGQFGLDASKIVWVREDNPQKCPDLDEQGLDFLPDFMTLVNADVILRANSTFSWWAAVLSDAKIYSPVVEARIGLKDVNFVEGNWPRMVDNANTGGRLTDLHLPE
jgi:hypothetical protein